jgi:putative membrane protein
MTKMNRWGLAGGLAAAIALFGTAQAQSATGSGSSSDQPTTGRGDTGGPPAGGTASGSQAPGREAGAGQAGQKVDKGLQEKLEKIHAANQAEVHLAEMGAQNAQSPEVKQFAEQMQADHQGLGEKLTAAAQSAGVSSLEGKTFQKEHDRAMKDNEKVQSKTGTDFDKAFMSRIVKDHEKSVKETESAAKDARKANQTELASFLEKASSGMKGHLEHAKKLRESVGRPGGEQMRQGRRPTEGTGSGAPESGAQQPGQQQPPRQ